MTAVHAIPAAGKAFAPLAGLIAGLGSVLINVQFWQALIIAVITGLIAAAGTVVGAYLAARVAARHTEPIRADIEDIRRASGLSKRAGD